MSFCIEIKADFALFTRPEFKVERVSYEIPTPSALRAVYQAILWKPAIEWQIDKIEVINPIKWISFRRNELKKIVQVNKLRNAEKGKEFTKYIETDRIQRASMMLKDVRYRVHAHFDLTDRAGNSDSEAKFAEMFRRRAGKGQCIYQPYLGTRECSCSFILVENTKAENLDSPINESKDLGFMLYDMKYSGNDGKGNIPMFFRAKMDKGVIIVPDKNSREVLA